MRKIVDTFFISKNKEDIFKNSIIVMDANILLSFYSYKEEHCDEVFSLLRNIEDRLWMPYHTLSEFMKNRTKVIKDELNNLNTKNAEISKSLNSISKQDLYNNIYEKMNNLFKKEYVGAEVYSRINNLFMKLNDITISYISTINEINKETKNVYKELREEKERDNIDSILNKLKDIYDGKVGEKYTHNKLVDISNEALEKTYYTVLPGLSREDLGKPTNRYGDYINYYSIVEYAKKEERDIIYITNDKKEDWCYKLSDKLEYHSTIYEDFHTRTNKHILIMPFDEFINSIDNYIDGLPEISEDTKKAIDTVTSENKLKDVSIDWDCNEINKAVMKNQWFSPRESKSDVFLIADFTNNIGRRVELLRSLDYKYFEGTLESVKIDIEHLINDSPDGVLYLIKLKEYEEIFKINATSIDYNKNNLKKYYFYLNGKPEWRIVFR